MKMSEERKMKGWGMLLLGTLLTFFLYYLYSDHSFEMWAAGFMFLTTPIIFLIATGIDSICGGEEPESDFIDWWLNPEKYKFREYIPYDPIEKKEDKIK